jgi:hypothetical protein
MEKRVRSRYFLLSGGLGGLAGFVLMEAVTFFSQGSGSRGGDILRMAVYFAGFGLAVGAALGMTEGYVQKKRSRMIYGLTMGLILGVVGGFVGGAVGQAIYGLVPRKSVTASRADVAIALDSSGSMGGFLWFFGANDPHGERKKAAKELIDHMSANDRVAVVDFDDTGKVFFPLTAVDSGAAREAARQAVDRIDDSGGTNLSAGLDLAIDELSRNKTAGRRQFLIFLTDGAGYYDGAAEQRAKAEGIAIYTIGLGSEVESALLTNIAQATGGKYYPVSNASQLSLLFQQIYVENLDMATQAGPPTQGASSGGGSLIHIILRIVSWALMGLAIGAGQGVRENTQEDLRACSLGGVLGGAVGGALFDPLTNAVSLGAGLVGRCLADVVVGACIGGSMRLAQQHIVEVPGRQTTTLLSVLPQKGGLTVLPEPAGRVEKPVPSPAVPLRPVPVAAKPVPVPAGTAANASLRPSLTTYQEKYTDRSQAMAMAYRSGDFTLKEIAQHFGVQSTTVKRAAEQYAGG